jgi:hypothetical protein
MASRHTRKGARMKKLLSWLANVVIAIVFGAGVAVLALEWMAGCGEYYIDSKGQVIQNECLFINLNK